MATLDSSGNVYSSGPGTAGLLAAWRQIQYLVGTQLLQILAAIRQAGR